jgi:BMFP domain-containing protein YqiC
MLDLKMIDELTRKLGDSLPPGVAQTKEEFERRFRSVLTSAFERMNLVSRKEFDARCAELEQARTTLAELQQRLDQIQPE